MLSPVDHVNIRTPDLARCCAFYEGVLGLRRGARPAFAFPGAWLYPPGADVAAVHVVEVAAAAPTDTGALDHVAFRATGLDAMRARAEAAGCPVIAQTVPGTTVTQLFLRDPDGVRIEVAFDEAAPAAIGAETERLVRIMAMLRDPARGCPWDRAQDFATIAPYTVEEAHEVAGAIAEADWESLPGELGDLLFQVVYHARLAEERGWFAYADIARAAADKMVRRHPHVFGDVASGDAAGGDAATWERAKSDERAAAGQSGALAGVSRALPALARADRLTARAARVGFDWPDAAAVLAKLDEEVAELQAELPAADPARLADEMGDMLFVLANLARKLGLDAETCLARASGKFERRFAAMERLLASDGHTPAEAGLATMEAAWRTVKRAERPADL